MTDTTPQPDPGNSPPEQWTESIPEDEMAEIAKRLQDETAGGAE